ncbi:peptide/nickel transport system substrate-binding protein [Cytobacillus eiseniae]|uniref:Peptide/nickel transport system substrate-binding protein n=1 Tax=Cytobacillus eiseniae TaxID=762947 RepID=A0ABS4RE38_9BACI|nr:peptide-binding protein [Cytobacillus eiseniae]MBP2241165.1 peptide/nickel transport system substrate-binding protein [Cytobacillus eiseniae]
MKKSAWFLVGLMLVLSMFLAACSGGGETTTEPEEPAEETPAAEEPAEEPASNDPVTGGDLIIGSTGAPTMFNTLYSSDASSSDIEGMIFDSLMGSDLEFNPVTDGGLAETFDASEDGKEFTIKIVENAKFHDGEPLDADDVVFTYNIPLSPDYDGVRKSYFENIETVEKVDQYTVKFTLKQVDAQFPVVSLGFGILPEHILGEVPVADMGEHEFNTKNPIGSGPFKFEEWKDGEYVKVVANADYWDGRPYLDSITYKLVPDANAILAQLQAGDIDYYAGIAQPDVPTVESFADAANLRLESGLALSYTFLGFNQRIEKFQDKNVRQAITHAIDRKAIVENVMSGLGEVAHVPESPLSWAYNPDVPTFEYDVEKAKQMLADAGWTPGSDGILEKDGERFSVEVKTNQGNKVREDIVVILQQQLKEVGIEIKPQIVEFSALIADIDPGVWNFEGIVLGWSLGVDPDPSGIFHTKEIEAGLNFTGYSNPALDELMDAQLQELDKEKRKAMIGEIQAGLAEDQPYTFLYYPEEFRAVPKNLEGYEFHPKNQMYHINKWWLKAE